MTMALMKTWLLLPLAALLHLSIVPTVGEVVNSMSTCAQFLLQQTPPHIPGILERGNILDQNRYEPICQTWNNKTSFVTLYDTMNKIPVFSAYKYTGELNKGRPQTSWKIEPQLENKSDTKNMRTASKSQTYIRQAGDNDYINTGLNRGHLFPSLYAYTENDKSSTFTLTNVVPQEPTFNQGSWKKMESCIKCVLDQYCITNNGNVEGFLVTGANPSTNSILNNRVNIPSMLWSAFCCRSGNQWLASAYLGPNVPEGPGKYLQPVTLADLQNSLGSVVFPGRQCPLHTNINQLYPRLNRACQCLPPPPISTTSASPTTSSVPRLTTSATSTSGLPSNTCGAFTYNHSPCNNQCCVAG